MVETILLAENAALTTSATPARSIRKTTLPNGLLVLTERMEHMRSVSMGPAMSTLRKMASHTL